mgnify:CR=1 FL=1
MALRAKRVATHRPADKRARDQVQLAVWLPAEAMERLRELAAVRGDSVRNTLIEMISAAALADDA